MTKGSDKTASSAKVETFLSQYDEQVFSNALKLRKVRFSNLTGIIEPAWLIAYCHGQKYTELICVIIPSKKGLKLGFNRGNELSDPSGLLEGTGKISRYVVINAEKEMNSPALKKLIVSALKLFKQRMTEAKK